MLNARQRRQLRRQPETNRLKAAMRLAKATQMDVAQGTGIGQSGISRIANTDGAGLTVSTAAKLAAYFGCTIEELFPGSAAVRAAVAS